MVDSGLSDGSYTPTSGNIEGRPILVTDPITSGIDSTYTLTFIPQSAIPKDGVIHIVLPEQLTLYPAIIRSGGSCTQNDAFVCTDVLEDKRTIVIQSKEKISGGSTVTINLTGVKNPRSNAPSDEFLVITFDMDGISEIDRGFRVGVQMQNLWQIDNFSVEPTSAINGEINAYNFTLSTRVQLNDGDMVQFVFPQEVTLPPADDLKISPISRLVGGASVTDDVMIDKVSDHKVSITFKKVAPTSNTYKWQILNIKNPPSTKPSSTFSDLFVLSDTSA